MLSSWRRRRGRFSVSDADIEEMIGDWYLEQIVLDRLDEPTVEWDVDDDGQW